MRTFNSAFEAKLSETSTAPIQLAVFGGVIFASDRDITIDGHAFEGIIEDWGTLRTAESGVSYTTLSIFSENFFERLGIDIVESVTVELYQTFEGLTYDQKELIDTFVIRDPIERSETSSLINLDLVSLHDKYRGTVGTKLTTTDWPLLPKALENGYLPVQTGSCELEAMLLTEADETQLVGSHIKGSTVLYVEENTFPASGSVQIQDEVYSYKSRTSTSIILHYGIREDYLDGTKVLRYLSTAVYGLCSDSMGHISDLKGDGVPITGWTAMHFEKGISTLHAAQRLTIETFEEQSSFVALHPDTIMGSNVTAPDTDYTPTDYNREAGQNTAMNAGYAFDDENDTYPAILDEGDKLQIVRRGSVDYTGDIVRAYVRCEVFLLGKQHDVLATIQVGDDHLGNLKLVSQGGESSTTVNFDYSHDHSHNVTSEHEHRSVVGVTDPGHSHSQAGTQLVYRSMYPYGGGAFCDYSNTTRFELGYGNASSRPESVVSEVPDSINSSIASHQRSISVGSHSYSGATVDDYNRNRTVVKLGAVFWLEFEHYLSSGGYSGSGMKYESIITCSFSFRDTGGHWHTHYAKCYIYKDDDTSTGNRKLSPLSGTLHAETATRFRLETDVVNVPNVPMRTILDRTNVRVRVDRVDNEYGEVRCGANNAQLVMVMNPGTSVTSTSPTSVTASGQTDATTKTHVELHDLNASKDVDVDVKETTNTSVTNFDVTDKFTSWDAVKNVPITVAFNRLRPGSGSKLYVLNATFEYEYKKPLVKVPSKITAMCHRSPETPTRFRHRLLKLSGVPTALLDAYDPNDTDLNGYLDGNLSCREADIEIQKHTKDTLTWVAGKAVTIDGNSSMFSHMYNGDSVLEKSMTIKRREYSDIVPVQRCKFTNGSIDISDAASVQALGEVEKEVDYPLFSDDQFNPYLREKIRELNVPTDIYKFSMFLEGIALQVGDVVKLDHRYSGKVPMKIIGTERTFGSGKLNRINTVKVEGMFIKGMVPTLVDKVAYLPENAPNGFEFLDVGNASLSGVVYPVTIESGNTGDAFQVDGHMLEVKTSSAISIHHPDYALLIKLTHAENTSSATFAVHIVSHDIDGPSFFKITGALLSWGGDVNTPAFDRFEVRRSPTGDWDTGYHLRVNGITASANGAQRGDIFMLRQYDVVGNHSNTMHIRTGIGNVVPDETTITKDYDGFPGTITGGIRLNDRIIAKHVGGLFLGPNGGKFMGPSSELFFEEHNYSAMTYKFTFGITQEHLGGTIKVNATVNTAHHIEYYDKMAWHNGDTFTPSAVGNIRMRVVVNAVDMPNIVPTISAVSIEHTVPVSKVTHSDVSIPASGVTFNDFQNLVAADIVLQDIKTDAVTVVRVDKTFYAENASGVKVAGNADFTLGGVNY